MLLGECYCTVHFLEEYNKQRPDRIKKREVKRISGENE
jgi:hypothetical protein